MTSPISDQPRRSVWDLVIEHIQQRRMVPFDGVVDHVVADMRACAQDPLSPDGNRLIAAYEAALALVGCLTTELDEHGATIDGPIDVRAPASARLVRVQAMLWDHIRMIVQLRALIEDHTP